jgi:FkbM family methyltransferase
VRYWLYRQSWLRHRLAPILKHSLPQVGDVILTVSSGPLRDMRLAVNRNTPNYYWFDDRYETEATAMLQKLARPGATVADIGAHIGFDTLVLSRRVGEAGTVLAFEPDPANLALLRKNVEINAITNVRVIDRAVAACTGMLAFDSQGLTTSHLMAPNEPLTSSATTVQAVSLDDLLYKERAPIPSLLKIDVEGYELAVLQGAIRFLSQKKPALLLELHTEQSMVECLALLAPLKYKFRLLDEAGGDFVAAALQGGPIAGFFICHIACVVDRT